MKYWNLSEFKRIKDELKHIWNDELHVQMWICEREKKMQWMDIDSKVIVTK